MMRIIGAMAVCFSLFLFGFTVLNKSATPQNGYNAAEICAELDHLFMSQSIPQADFFLMPVGKPNGKGYYNAQAFGKNDHLGDDWNGIGGGNTDFGDEVTSAGNGWVYKAQHEGPGWGNVVRIIHRLPDGNEPKYVESLYAHLDKIHVSAGQMITAGSPVGTIGNADGVYLAHLHLELRSEPKRPLGGGYGLNKEWFLDPTVFIRNHQK
jgi:murein DD-endopeptidase MepM/ murein hydrolase activator NlpD